jgi:hypothetical protein
MEKSLFKTLSKSLNLFPENILFLLIGTTILIIPMVATIGQFLSTSYFQKTVPILLLFWPGSDFTIKIQMLVWIFMGLVFISYLTGIAYMFHNRSLGKVILLTILAFMCSGLLRATLTRIFGWQESAMPDLAGKANAAILSQWHNPIWEEVVFRGGPLLILLSVEKYITKKRTIIGIVLYFLVPAVVFGFYHIPGHGIIRFFDTLLLGTVFSWLALRYTFFAPMVMHYIADAMIVMNLNKIPSVQPSEVKWLIEYGSSLNSFYSLFILLLVIMIPVLTAYYFMKIRRQSQTE